MAELSRTMACVQKGLYAAFTILQEHGGEMPSRELFPAIEAAIELTEWEKGFTKSGGLRWQTTLQFYSIDCVAGGFLVKEKRIWYLTPEGAALLKGGKENFLDNLYRDYEIWGKSPDLPTANTDDEKAAEAIEKNDDVFFDDLQEKLTQRISAYLDQKSPYEFQDLVAALLRGMGYYIAHVSPPGKDGGIDIVAYQNPLGVTEGRIIVQVKHTKERISNGEINKLQGLLQRPGDVGIFVSSGGFTSDAQKRAQDGKQHIELIDQDKFINLWMEHYEKLTISDRLLFPLKNVYFLDKK